MSGPNRLDIFAAFSRLGEASTAQLRWQALVSLLGTEGFDVVNYAVLDTTQAGRSSAGVTQFSTMPQDWIGYYLEKRLDLHDPHVRLVRQGLQIPYRFFAEGARSLEDPLEADVINQAAEVGLSSQISFIAPDPSGGNAPVAGMTIGSSLRRTEFTAATRGLESNYLAIAMMFHTLCIGEVRREQVGARPLSRRERDCLAYFADGHRVARIAEKLGLAEATVSLHLANARRKLKARTSAQAVARAVVFGEFPV